MRLRPGPRALWFLRHGESEGNVVRDAAVARGLDRYELATRDADVPLSPLGRRQAETVGRWLGNRPDAERPTAVLASPYVRSRQTAELVVAAAGPPLAGAPIHVDERLRDREAGLWEGLTWRGIVATYPEEAGRARLVGRYYHRPPGGESWADIVLRLRAVLAELRHDWADERVLLVSHDLPIQLSRGVIEAMDEAAVVALVGEVTYANAALSMFEADDGGYRLAAYNAVVLAGRDGGPETG
jgi:broad specificity phosphatase PhoE